MVGSGEGPLPGCTLRTPLVSSRGAQRVRELSGSLL